MCKRLTGMARRYGLLAEEYTAMWKAQDGSCAICQRDMHYVPTDKGWQALAPVVDHDHVSQKVRGLLCGKCNSALGYFEDNPVAIISAAHYILEHHRDRMTFASLCSLWMVARRIKMLVQGGRRAKDVVCAASPAVPDAACAPS
jgi:hypothetical protein